MGAVWTMVEPANAAEVYFDPGGELIRSFVIVLCFEECVKMTATAAGESEPGFAF